MGNTTPKFETQCTCHIVCCVVCHVVYVYVIMYMLRNHVVYVYVYVTCSSSMKMLCVRKLVPHKRDLK